jgi:gluconolactonase
MNIPANPGKILIQGKGIRVILLLIMTGWMPLKAQQVGKSTLVEEGATVQKMGDGFRFTEGPVSDAEGNIYFSDIPNNRIHKWSPDGEISVFKDPSGNSNGLAVDSRGNLIACRHGGRDVVSIDPEGNETVLAHKYKGKKLNSPNDLWIDPAGGIYFTDPRYGNRDNMEQDGEHVYYLSPNRKKLVRIADDLERPNGIIGTPDGKILYVADHGADKTYRYKINPDGSLADKKLFTSSGSDGMAMDEKGNVYLTTDAVHIYSPEGDFLESIVAPEQPANVCFGGGDGRTLFITARKSLYSIRMKVGPAKPGR